MSWSAGWPTAGAADVPGMMASRRTCVHRQRAVRDHRPGLRIEHEPSLRRLLCYCCPARGREQARAGSWVRRPVLLRRSAAPRQRSIILSTGWLIATSTLSVRAVHYVVPRKRQNGSPVNSKIVSDLGAACRNRTDDLFITSEPLCRL